MHCVVLDFSPGESGRRPMTKVKSEFFCIDLFEEVSPSADSIELHFPKMVEGLGFGLGEVLAPRFPELFAELTGGEDLVESALHLVGDEKMRELNGRYRHKETTTDVLSFPVHDNLLQNPPPWPSPLALGDIVISVPVAKKQAKIHARTLLEEITNLFVHGFLHLLGFDHERKDDEGVMLSLEEEIIKIISQKGE
ncbi:MAG: rRNA maturation RNase YbeY [Bacteriovoracales bacterium]|nr:rRNA maturation RNase YbeY [Bacteriovoracales bacterium]